MELSARIVSLELAETFTIARGSQDTAEVVKVEIRHEGVSGYGEAAPIDRYGESAESALAYAESVAGELGDDPFAPEEVMQRLPAEQFAARAAIDAGLHDLCGKLLGEPVWRLLGLEPAGPPTSWTIGLADPDETARKAERATKRLGRSFYPNFLPRKLGRSIEGRIIAMLVMLFGIGFLSVLTATIASRFVQTDTAATREFGGRVRDPPH